MKNITKKSSFVILFVVVVLLLAACGEMTQPRNGTYVSGGLIPQTWTFSGGNNITLSVGGGLVATTGTFTIDGTRLTITTRLLGIESTSSYTITEIRRNSFRIDGTLFERQ